MSLGFEDNFFTSVEENPFQDPSVTRVTNNANNVSNGLEDYNPYSPNQSTNFASSTSPAVVETTQQPPEYNRSAQQQQRVIADFEERQRELDRKAEELQKREDALNKQHNVRRNNWPPFPDGFCLTPCFYLDISVEIESNFQKIVRHLYYLWLLHTIVLVCNVIGCFLLLITFSEFATFGVSIIYLFLFAPLSFLCWYRPVYKAFRDDSSFQFLVFFFVFFFQFLTTTFMAVGILNTGACGILKAINCFNAEGVGVKVVGVFVLIIALGFSATAAAELLLLAKMLNIYRGTNATMAKARNEFTSEILGNQIVRQAASDTAAATIRSHLNQQSNRT